MTPDWISEGIRQIQLALLWSWLANDQSNRAQAAASSKSQLAFEESTQISQELSGCVVELLSHEWISGSQKLTNQIIEQRLHTNEAAPTGDFWFLHPLEHQIRSSLAPFRADGPASTDPTDPSNRAIRVALARAINSVLGNPGQPGEPPAAPGGQAKRASRSYPSAVAASNWLTEAVVLSKWERLGGQIENQQQAEANLTRVPPLARECKRIGDWLDDCCSGQFAFGQFLFGTGPIRERLRTASDCLHQSHAVLTKLVSPSVDRSVRVLRLRREALQHVQASLQQAPQNWPPRLLATFQTELAKLGPAAPGSILMNSLVETPRSEDQEAGPQATLVLALADQLVAHGPQSPVAWDHLERLAGRVLDEPATKFKLLHDPRPGADHTVYKVALPDGASPELTRPGLVAWRDGRETVIRRAAVAIARPRPRAVAPCRRLAACLREPGRSPELAELFDRVAEGLDAHRDLASWWAGAAAEPQLESLGRFWQAVQRASSLAADRSSPAAPAAADLLAELRHDVKFVEPAPLAKARSNGLWLLAAEGKQPRPSPLDGTPTLALEGPDKRVLQPANWINVPASWPKESPILQALIDAQPLLTGLHGRDPDWAGWSDMAELGWDLAYSRLDPARSGPIDSHVAAAAFAKAYESSRIPNGRLHGPFRELARRLYVGLKKEGVKFVPELDGETLDPRPLTGPPPIGTKIEWMQAREVPGTVVQVVRVGIGGAPAELRLSLGPNPPAGLVDWLDWIQHAPKPATGSEPAQVKSLRIELPELLLKHDLDQAMRKLNSLRQEFRETSESEVGRARFDAIVRSREPALVSLLAVLTKTGWCEIWPEIDPGTGHFRWPAGLSVGSAPAVRWSTDPGLPLGHAAADRGARYAPRRELIEGCFSFGAPVPGTPLAAAIALGEGQTAEPLRGPIREILVTELDTALGNSSPAEPRMLLARLLDGVTAAAVGPGIPAPALDTMLARARDWARSRGIEILPALWSFVEPPPIDRLQAEGCVVDPPRFGGSPADARRPRLAALGWEGAADASGRLPRVEIFAGPAPPRYDDLLTLLNADTSIPGRDRMLKNLLTWPTYSATDDPSYRYDRDALFDEFWRAAADVPRTPAIQQAEALLNGLLAEGFGLEIYRPRDTQSHAQDEYQVIARGDRKTGRVRHVRRPGLKGPGGVRFPAEIELE